MTSPSNQNRLTQLTATALGARLWRMTVGLGWFAAPERTIKATKPLTVTMQPGDVLLRQARPFRAGCVGMSDGGGFVPVVVTADMVGKTVAVSLWIEDKQGRSRASDEQKSFIRMVRSFGGRAGVSRCDEDTKAIIEGEIRD
jgi:hypothetical protein